jgi:uncharacterized protein YjlB
MPLKDQIKNFARKAVESRPEPTSLKTLIRPRKPITVLFDDDGIVPNNPRLPLIIYRSAIDLGEKTYEPGAIIDAVFESNGWARSWRDTIYDFVHYHSQIHETMGVAHGSAVVEFGGVRGRRMRLKAGDVSILPAGTGHRLIEASRGFLVVGAYPADGTYDECTDTRERVEASKRITKTPKPDADPVYGKGGPLKAIWAGKKKR